MFCAVFILHVFPGDDRYASVCVLYNSICDETNSYLVRRCIGVATMSNYCAPSQGEPCLLGEDVGDEVALSNCNVYGGTMRLK